MRTGRKLTIGDRRIRKSRLGVVVRYILVFIIAVFVANIFFSYKMSLSRTHTLISENELFAGKIKDINNYVLNVNKQISEIDRRDSSSYRMTLGLDSYEVVESCDEIDANYILISDRYSYLIDETWNLLYNTKDNILNMSLTQDTVSNIINNYENISRYIPAIWPVDASGFKGGFSPFGYRNHPILKRKIMHGGLDLSCKRNTAVIATADGVVEAARGGWNGGYGNEIVINHGFGYKTRYAHLHTKSVKHGDVVRRGDKIGGVGSTGRSTGDHLHYEVIYRNKKVDPINYFTSTQSREDAAKLLENARIEILEDVEAENPDNKNSKNEK